MPCHNAYRYGLHLAEEMGLDAVLVHYYSGSIDPRKPLVLAGDGSISGSYQERLRQFASPGGDGVDYPPLEIPRGVTLRYETDVRLVPSAAIIARAKESDISTVVMATRSSKVMLQQWLGSTSITVSEACDRPVFLIPPRARFTSFKRIVVANNHATADPYPLGQVEELANFYGGLVHFVHVEWPDQGAAFRFTPWWLMNELIEKEPEATYPFEVVTVEDTDVANGLLEYAEKVGADLVVVVNRLRSRWRSLLRASLAQDVALRTDRPLLVLHTKDEPENTAS